MLAMQYSFTLPAAYDMAIIRRRIAEKGPLLDGFPGLAFKAYLSADRGDTGLPSDENLYAPFYLWRGSEGMNTFLTGPGFAALTQAFGWPQVRLWSAYHARMSPELRSAVCATREIIQLPAHVDLGERLRHERDAADAEFAEGALAVVSAFEPTGWTLVRLRLWPERRSDLAGIGRQLYRVGHVSTSTT